MKIIETREYVAVLRELTEEGQKVTMQIAGNSMLPFLAHGRDYITFQKPRDSLKVGDMVFYQRKTGNFVMHRIQKITPQGYFLVGDAQWQIEGPIERTQIFAKITQVQRKGRLIGPGNFWWEFFEHIWIRIIPLRKTILRIYGKIKQ